MSYLEWTGKSTETSFIVVFNADGNYQEGPVSISIDCESGDPWAFHAIVFQTGERSLRIGNVPSAAIDELGEEVVTESILQAARM